jgi:hypothetical protein
MLLDALTSSERFQIMEKTVAVSDSDLDRQVAFLEALHVSKGTWDFLKTHCCGHWKSWDTVDRVRASKIICAMPFFLMPLYFPNHEHKSFLSFHFGMFIQCSICCRGHRKH